jgi:hypothetical protein
MGLNLKASRKARGRGSPPQNLPSLVEGAEADAHAVRAHLLHHRLHNLKQQAAGFWVFERLVRFVV